VKKHKKLVGPRTLELKKETLAKLTHDQLKHVVGANKSTTPSQCVTLCFTR